MFNIEKSKNFLLSEIKINKPNGIINARQVGNDMSVLFLEKEHEPSLPPEFDGDYIRRYKNHVSQYFSDKYNNGEIIPNYKHNIKLFTEWLRKMGVKFEENEKYYPLKDYNMTSIKIPLRYINII